MTWRKDARPLPPHRKNKFYEKKTAISPMTMLTSISPPITHISEFLIHLFTRRCSMKTPSAPNTRKAQTEIQSVSNSQEYYKGLRVCDFPPEGRKFLIKPVHSASFISLPWLRSSCSFFLP